MTARALPGGLVLIVCLGSILICSLKILGMVQFSPVPEKLRPFHRQDVTEKDVKEVAVTRLRFAVADASGFLCLGAIRSPGILDCGGSALCLDQSTMSYPAV